MAPKRTRDEEPTTGAPDKKKAKHGFRVGPDNLPDGAWKRKGSHYFPNVYRTPLPCILYTNVKFAIN